MGKQYLGDSVYADIQDGMIRLTTDNGYGPSNTILLEPEVYDALAQYVERIKALGIANRQRYLFP